MPRISREASLARRDQVIDACAELYRTQGYHDITLAQIAEGLTFGRANIYNYFQNKEEVFLALLQREHEAWAKDLTALEQAIRCGSVATDDAALARALAESLEPRTLMLKVLATSLFDLEQFVRTERLVDLKLAYKAVVESLASLLTSARPAWDEGRTARFTFSFLPFLHGVYAYAHHTDRQLEAMREAGMDDPGLGVVELCETCARKLLQDD